MTHQDVFDSSIRSKGDMAGVFEYDGDSGYFYLFNTKNVQDHQVVGAIRVLIDLPPLSWTLLERVNTCHSRAPPYQQDHDSSHLQVAPSNTHQSSRPAPKNFLCTLRFLSCLCCPLQIEGAAVSTPEISAFSQRPAKPFHQTRIKARIHPHKNLWP